MSAPRVTPNRERVAYTPPEPAPSWSLGALMALGAAVIAPVLAIVSEVLS